MANIHVTLAQEADLISTLMAAGIKRDSPLADVNKIVRNQGKYILFADTRQFQMTWDRLDHLAKLADQMRQF